MLGLVLIVCGIAVVVLAQALLWARRVEKGKTFMEEVIDLRRKKTKTTESGERHEPEKSRNHPQ